MAEEVSVPENLGSGQAEKVAAIWICELSDGIGKSLEGQDIKVLCRLRLDHAEIVIAQDGENSFRLQQLQTFSGVGIVAYQITQMNDVVYRFARDGPEHGFKRFQIPMDIGDDSDTRHSLSDQVRPQGKGC